MNKLNSPLVLNGLDVLPKTSADQIVKVEGFMGGVHC